MKSRDPNRSESARVVEPMSADEVAALMDAGDEATEIVIPTCGVPTNGANGRGSASANHMVRDPGFIIEKEQVGRYASANRRSTSCSILLREGAITREAKASSRKTRIVDWILDVKTSPLPAFIY